MHVLLTTFLFLNILFSCRCSIMFWTDWGYTPKIEKANMDGTGRTTIIIAGLGYPNGLAIDYSQNLIFWTDAKTKQLESADFSGNNRRVLLDLSSGSSFPFGLVLHRKSLYWTDWNTKSVHRYDMLTRENSTLIIGISKPMGLVIYDSQALWNGEAFYILTNERERTYFGHNYRNIFFKDLTYDR